MKKIAIVGTAGVPASYGGFETLADNLVKYKFTNKIENKLIVFCTTKASESRPSAYFGADLRYIPIGANGIASIFYDIISMVLSAFERYDVVLLLGVSGAIAIPIIKLFSDIKIVTNIDGVEWKRAKWGPLSKEFLRISETIAVKYSDEIIADNQGIAEHIKSEYRRTCKMIEYGGDNAKGSEGPCIKFDNLPKNYMLSLCRIEPENNAHLILEAFSLVPDATLVFVGNWNINPYGKRLYERYNSKENIRLYHPIYNQAQLFTIRSQATAYVHGHSAGGTNPSLVEMMHFDLPVLTYNCAYNRFTTEDKALYFSSVDDLVSLIKRVQYADCSHIGHNMREIALRRYTWNIIGRTYFDLLMST